MGGSDTYCIACGVAFTKWNTWNTDSDVGNLAMLLRWDSDMEPPEWYDENNRWLLTDDGVLVPAKGDPEFGGWEPVPITDLRESPSQHPAYTLDNWKNGITQPYDEIVLRKSFEQLWGEDEISEASVGRGLMMHKFCAFHVLHHLKSNNLKVKDFIDDCLENWESFENLLLGVEYGIVSTMWNQNFLVTQEGEWVLADPETFPLLSERIKETATANITEPPPTATFLSNLGIPTEVFEHICTYLPINDVVKVALVNRATRTFIISPSFSVTFHSVVANNDLLPPSYRTYQKTRVNWYAYALECVQSTNMRSRMRILEVIGRVVKGFVEKSVKQRRNGESVGQFVEWEGFRQEEQAGGPLRWIPHKMYRPFPRNAPAAGHDEGGESRKIYVGRVHREDGSIQPGKVAPASQWTANYAWFYDEYDGEEMVAREYEILFGDFGWVSHVRGTPVPANAFVAGTATDGTALYVARASWPADWGGLHVGKIGESTGWLANISWGGTVYQSGVDETHEVLVEINREQ
ncbi:hypothetical protein HK097_002842 [Rhizophlyctis rosea]|uniref:F-box domain-containing protein n=1 Tax=Rhizophlyctis rosea TaxID=64517 RepID=A0AAD5SGZ7_9FUNG|nr:hypothetical protein HK097_002842 [Rhizophlyctis rosea]